VHIDLWTLALQAINVLVLVWLLSRFLYRPVMRAVAARQAAADKLLADAETARSDASAMAAALQVQQASFEAKAADHRAAMLAGVAEERGRLIDQANAEAAAIRDRMHAAMEVDRARDLRGLQEQAALLAGAMALKLINRLPGDLIASAMCDALCDRVRSLTDSERSRLVGPDGFDIVTAVPLSAEEQERLRTALSRSLPGCKPGAMLTDPNLIAGAELRAPDLVVRNSWRADLDAMLAQLMAGEDNAASS